MKKVSVIVPVYNTEKYLRRCLNSLVNQTIEDIEIIVINDCSPDNSKEILKEYEKKYKDKIKVFHNKTNKGIGYNRNYGIKKATGEYIGFVDSDDYLDIDNLEKMYNFAKNNDVDLVICNLKKVDINGKVLGYEEIQKFDLTNIKKSPEILLNINLGPANKLFSKEIFKDKNNRFPINLKYEDLAILPKLICDAKKIGFVEDSFYNYVIHEESETTTVDKRVFDVLKVMDQVNFYLKKYDFPQIYLEFLNIRTLFRYTLQQKKQKDNNVKYEFVNQAFKYLDKNFPNWRKNKIYKKRNILKRTIEQSKLLTKLYIRI